MTPGSASHRHSPAGRDPVPAQTIPTNEGLVPPASSHPPPGTNKSRKTWGDEEEDEEKRRKERGEKPP